MKWEYLIKNCNGAVGPDPGYCLEKAGEEGWELAAVVQFPDCCSVTLYFKRPLAEKHDGEGKKG